MTIASLPMPSVSGQTAIHPVIDMAILSKSLENVAVSGQSMIKMMEQSVSPNLGSNIDISI